MTAPAFTEEWFGEASREALADLYGLVADLEGDIIEVGSWQGRSTIALANAAHPAVVHAVDTWEGSPGEVSADLAAARLLTHEDVHRTFLANVAAYSKGNVEAHRMDWRKFFADYQGRIKFLFVDATHTYLEVKENLEAALPFLVEGAVVVGDDVHHPPIQQAVVDVFGDANCVATLWWVQR